jgi:hypothetical protein
LIAATRRKISIGGMPEYLASYWDLRSEAGTHSHRLKEIAMRPIKLHPRWDDRLDAIPPLAGSLVAFISLFIVLMIVIR